MEICQEWSLTTIAQLTAETGLKLAERIYSHSSKQYKNWLDLVKKQTYKAVL